MVEREAVEVAGERTLLPCPECPETLPLDDLARHIERHRPVELGGSILCPKGCGRTFTPGLNEKHPERTPRNDIRGHIENCIGEPPLPVDAPPAEEKRKEETVARFTCEECPDLKFASPQGLGAHRRHAHPGAAKARRGRPKAEDAEKPEAEGGESEPLVALDTGSALPIKDRILGLLEVEEERLEKELGHCKALIAAVRESGGGKDRPT